MDGLQLEVHKRALLPLLLSLLSIAPSLAPALSPLLSRSDEAASLFLQPSSYMRASEVQAECQILLCDHASNK